MGQGLPHYIGFYVFLSVISDGSYTDSIYVNRASSLLPVLAWEHSSAILFLLKGKSTPARYY